MRREGTVVYGPVKTVELVGFGLAFSTSDTTWKMNSLKQEVYFSGCPYIERKTKFKETNDMLWHFLMHGYILVVLHL
uniref:Uncharacterized protein n=1 Tax=Monodon monoceros TaxID=40151 RepID=A0A8C6B7B5_MONMO